MDSKRDFRVILHPTASIWEIRRGLDPGSDDSVDLSEFVTQGSQTAFDVNITLKFRRELFGAAQPAPNQVLEIQLQQRGEWKTCWLGIVDALNGYTLSRGERSMQLIAKSRDQQDIWRKTNRLTPLFPQLTDLTYIAQRVARSAEMKGDEIVLPRSSYTTAHTNTQLADMNAWDMVTQVFMALGWTPYMDGLGRLRAADRNLQGRRPDVVLRDERLIKVGGQRQRPPKSRVRVLWLNPTLKKEKRQGRMLGSPVTITLGWFIPYWKKTVWFSEDHTQRAENTYINTETSSSVNQYPKTIGIDLVREEWIQQEENKGKLSFVSYHSILAMLAALTTIILKIKTRSDFVAGRLDVPDLKAPTHLEAGGIGFSEVVGVITLNPATNPTLTTRPKSSLLESVAMYSWMLLAMTIGTGTYEIWGTPYDWVHARNVSEAFDSSVPIWVDNVEDIESDFMVNEEHAKATAIRELIYQARAANKWSATIVDDPRIEFGDILQFDDGSQLYVEDYTRSLERGSEATLEVKGFLIPVTAVVRGTGFIGATINPPEIATAPGGGGSAPSPGGGGTPAPGNKGIGHKPNPPTEPLTSLSQVHWIDHDISGWPETYPLEVHFPREGSITLEQQGTSNWPLNPDGGAGNAWIFVYRDGQWYAGTWEWMLQNQKTKFRENLMETGAIAKPLKDFTVQPGEVYGFMVSGVARYGPNNIQERTSLAYPVTWPDTGTPR